MFFIGNFHFPEITATAKIHSISLLIFVIAKYIIQFFFLKYDIFNNLKHTFFRKFGLTIKICNTALHFLYDKVWNQSSYYVYKKVLGF